MGHRTDATRPIRGIRIRESERQRNMNRLQNLDKIKLFTFYLIVAPYIQSNLLANYILMKQF